MEQVASSNILGILFFAGLGVIALVVGVLLLRWVLGVSEILKALQEIRDELQILRERQGSARPTVSARPDAPRPDVPQPGLSALDVPIPDEWRLGRQDKK